MNARIWPLALILSFFVGACFGPLPSSDAIDEPDMSPMGTPIKGTAYLDDEQLFHDVRNLGRSLGTWYGMRLLNYPADFALVEVQIWGAVPIAEDLGLILSEEQLISSVDETKVESIISGITDEIEQIYGTEARIDFEIGLYINTVTTLHYEYYSLYQKDGAEQYLLLLGADFLRQVGDLLEPRTNDEEILLEIENIRAALLAMPATYEELILLYDRLISLEYTSRYAMRGLPTPAPTLVPTPSLAGAVDTDITKMLPVGDPERGAELNTTQACIACHLLNAGRGVAQPWKDPEYAGNKGIGTRAQERWQQDEYTGNATSAVEYLVESIVLPDADVMDGYVKGIMPRMYGEMLSDQDIADLVVFMLEIK